MHLRREQSAGKTEVKVFCNNHNCLILLYWTNRSKGRRWHRLRIPGAGITGGHPGGCPRVSPRGHITPTHNITTSTTQNVLGFRNYLYSSGKRPSPILMTSSLVGVSPRATWGLCFQLLPINFPKGVNWEPCKDIPPSGLWELWVKPCVRQRPWRGSSLKKLLVSEQQSQDLNTLLSVPLTFRNQSSLKAY